MIRARILALLVALVTSVAGVASAGAATAVSSNWSGYAVTGATFSSVTGTWVQPAANCTAATGVTSSAFWVGLGGDSTTSSALEQVGTEADCTPAGAAVYSAWYELVPAASVRVGLKVAAGDELTASVKVDGSKVTVAITNRTTGASFTKTLAMAAPDVSSAEWVAEAPSLLTDRGAQVLPLTDFSTVTFKNATATSSDGHTGGISDSTWTATRIQLLSDAGLTRDPFARFAAVAGAEALPTVVGSSGRTFAIRWRQAAAPAAAAPPGYDPNI